MASSFLEKIDILADEEAPIHQINFEGETKYRSSLGGFCTLLIAVTFLSVLISESEEVIKKKYPFVQRRLVEDLMPEGNNYKDFPPIIISFHDAS